MYRGLGALTGVCYRCYRNLFVRAAAPSLLVAALTRYQRVEAVKGSIGQARKVAFKVGLGIVSYDPEKLDDHEDCGSAVAAVVGASEM